MPGLTDSGFLQLVQGGIHILEASQLGTIRTNADRFKMAFYAPAASIGKATEAYSATNEVAGGGYTAGGADVVPDVVSFLDGLIRKVRITFPDIEYTNSPTFTAGFALLYNATNGKNNASIAFWDFAPAVTATGTTFSFGPQAAANMAPIVFG